MLVWILVCSNYFFTWFTDTILPNGYMHQLFTFKSANACIVSLLKVQERQTGYVKILCTIQAWHPLSSTSTIKPEATKRRLSLFTYFTFLHTLAVSIHKALKAHQFANLQMWQKHKVDFFQERIIIFVFTR